MSRLDYVTIAIVAVCVAALVYLIYMTTNLLGNGPDEATTADQTPAEQESTYEDDAYYPEDSTATFDDGYYKDGEAASDDAGDYSGEDGQTGSEDPRPAYEDATDELSTSSGSRSTSTTGKAETDYASVASGQYMVLAGTFKYRNNAEDMVKKLKGMGYSGATVELFDRGRYAVALVNRFDGLGEAKALKSELSGKGVESYVKQK
ncbi:MAG: SPOR domain-containing protein [Phaeodactylibacter sp.]|uniref:SPOR domain-containing protein n=1 Tax=Phaeodactylibacter sp. TaxID=1940289 RepID=UPI0032ED1368